MDKKINIGIVAAEFNYDVTYAMVELAKEHAKFLNAEVVEAMKVPGTYDIPFGVKILLSKKNIDCIVTLGAVIEGQTEHDDIIAQQAARKVMDLSLEFNKPVALGISGPGMSRLEAHERVDYAKRAVEAAVKMCKIKFASENVEETKIATIEEKTEEFKEEGEEWMSAEEFMDKLTKGLTEQERKEKTTKKAEVQKKAKSKKKSNIRGKSKKEEMFAEDKKIEESAEKKIESPKEKLMGAEEYTNKIEKEIAEEKKKIGKKRGRLKKAKKAKVEIKAKAEARQPGEILKEEIPKEERKGKVGIPKKAKETKTGTESEAKTEKIIKKIKSEEKEKIIEELKKKGKITTGEVMKMFNVAKSTAWNAMNELLKEGGIIRKGKKNTSHYVLA